MHSVIYLQHMTMMFEVADLSVASPATVSRCGMVYLGTTVLGISPFIECWLWTLPNLITQYKEKFESLFGAFLEVLQTFDKKKSAMDFIFFSFPCFSPVTIGN